MVLIPGKEEEEEEETILEHFCPAGAAAFDALPSHFQNRAGNDFFDL